MTIFHTLKYPVSDPPTAEQLEALPPNIYRKWTHHPDFTFRFGHLFTPPIYSSENVALLRKIIVEYKK